MKTTLWATLSANGNYARSTPQNPPRRQALEDFAAQARAHGNFIVGRRTFEEFQAQPQRADSDAGAAFAATTIVVVSSTLSMPGVACAPTPQAALALLRERGFERALLAGGEKLHNAFLAADLVDELVINIAPALEDDGLRVVLPRGHHRELALRDSRDLGGGVFQLRYSLERR